jgi:hypothetical protein
MKKVNYLNNKDLLEEIHKSKSSFCSFIDAKYTDYDLIVKDIGSINIRTVAQAKRNKAKKLTQIDYEIRKKANPKTKLSECEIDYRKIQKDDLVNFPPFQHFKYDKKGNLVCVGKSHWEGGLHNGKFNKDSGQATNELARMWMKLCERYATRGNVRGYTYNDEMQGQAILQLAQIGLQFDESKSNNPFAYYTAAVTNSFVRIINIEKRNQNIRDDILEMNDMMPSMTRQTQDTKPPAKKPVQKKFAKKKKK